MNSQFLKISNSAVFRFSNESGSVDYLTAFEKLFLTLASVKNYTLVDVVSIKNDFRDFYGLELNSFFVQEFINRLFTAGYIYKNKNDKQKYFERNKINELNLEANLEQIKKETNLFTDGFYSFLIENKNEMVKEACETLICKCIEHSICSLSLKNVSAETTVNPTEKYLFDCFLKKIKDEGSELFAIYKKIMFGRVYTAVIAQNDISNNKLFAYKKVKLFFDSGFVFNALGMNYYVDKTEYLELLKELKAMGASLCIFNHTFIEMKDIIENAIQWIDNNSFDQFFASKTATYFVLSKCSKSDASSLFYNFQNILNDLGIQVYEDFDVDYDKPEGIEITNLQYKIIEEYKKKNTYDDNKFEAYVNDAKSIFFIHKLRKKRIYRRFSDVDYVFVTNNTTISRISIDFHEKTFNGAKGVPAAISDSLLSTLVWFESNNYNEQDNLMFLIPSVYHAFEPSLSLLEKMNTVFASLKEKGEMSDSAIHEWKTDTAYQKCIISYTKNNPDNFDEETPGQILKDLKNDVTGVLTPFLKDYEKNKEKLKKRIMAKKRMLVIFLAIFYLALFVGLYFLLDLIVSLIMPDYRFASILIDALILGVTTLLSFITINNKKIAVSFFNFIDSKIVNKNLYKKLKTQTERIDSAKEIMSK